jgi:hypothetical protein
MALKKDIQVNQSMIYLLYFYPKYVNTIKKFIKVLLKVIMELKIIEDLKELNKI